MASGAQFIVELVDRITGPAKKAMESIKAMQGAGPAGAAGGKGVGSAADPSKAVTAHADAQVKLKKTLDGAIPSGTAVNNVLKGTTAGAAAATPPVKKLGDELKKTGDAGKIASSGIEEAGKGAEKAGGFMASIKSKVEALSMALVALAAAFVVYKIDELFKKAFGTAAEEAGKLDSNIKALTFRLGSIQKAKDVEAKLTKMSEGTAFKASDLEKMFQQQLKEGVDADLAMTMTKLAMNVGAMAGGPKEANAAASEAVSEFVSLRQGERWDAMAGSWDKIKGTAGKFGADDDALMKVLHEKFGKQAGPGGKGLDLAQFKRSLQDGNGHGIRNSDMMLAITETVKRQAKAGGASDAFGIAAKMGDTFEGLQAQVENLPERVVRKYATDGMFAGLEDQSKRIMKTFLEVGDTSTVVGARMEEAWKSVSVEVEKAMGKVSSNGMEGEMFVMADAIEVLGVAWAAFYGPIGSTFSAFGEVFKEVFGAKKGADMKFLTDGLKTVGKILGWVVTAFLVGLAAVAVAFVFVLAAVGKTLGALGDLIMKIPKKWDEMCEWLEAGWKRFKDWLGGLGKGVSDALARAKNWFLDGFAGATNWLSEIGKNIVDGLWNGITAGWGKLLAGFKDLLQLLPEGVKKVLDIHSPSRVMMALGGHTAEGFSQGIQQTDISSAWQSLAAGADGAAFGSVPMGLDVTGADTGLRAAKLGPGAAGGGGGGGGGGATIGEINITVNAPGGDADSIAEAVRAVAREELVAALSGMATEGGSMAAASG